MKPKISVCIPTYNGAKFLGIEKQYGSLEKGKQPGIINIDPEMLVTRVL